MNPRIPHQKKGWGQNLMFSSEHAPQLSQTTLKVQWPLRFDFSYVQPVTQRYRRKTVKEVPLQQSSHHENTTIRAPPTINYCLESAVAILRFAFSYVQPVTQHYKRRTVLESSLQSVQSPRKIRTIPIYKCTVGKPCIVLPRIDTFGSQHKEMGHKGGQR